MSIATTFLVKEKARITRMNATSSHILLICTLAHNIQRKVHNLLSLFLWVEIDHLQHLLCWLTFPPKILAAPQNIAIAEHHL